MSTNIYTNGDYLINNPIWYVEDSIWKANNLLKILIHNKHDPKSICEVGFGARDILKKLLSNMSGECEFWGYEISPKTFELSQQRANEKLHFKLKEVLQEINIYFDIVLLIDMIEHLEDYFNFLWQLKIKNHYKILHILLDLSMQSVFRKGRLFKARRSSCHFHYFSKETALESLVDLGYEVIDYFYSAPAIDLQAQSRLAQITKTPRSLLFSLNPGLASRTLGGFSLIVLEK